MHKKFFITFCFFLSTIPSAHAVFTYGFEPYAGWELMGKVVAKGSSNPDKFSGPVLGSRLSVLLNRMFFVGADVSSLPLLSYSSYDAATSSYIKSDSANNIKFGIIAGVKITQAPLRAWIGYNFLDNTSYNSASVSGTLIDSSTTNQINYMNAKQNTRLNASSFKVGASYHLTKAIHINVEYLRLFYSSYTLYGYNLSSIEDTTTETTLAVSDLSSNLFVFSLSAPLQFHLF